MNGTGVRERDRKREREERETETVTGRVPVRAICGGETRERQNDRQIEKDEIYT